MFLLIKSWYLLEDIANDLYFLINILYLNLLDQFFTNELWYMVLVKYHFKFLFFFYVCDLRLNMTHNNHFFELK